MNGLSSPADLGINSAGDSIGIPNSGSANNVVFYAIPGATGIHEIKDNTAQLFPNPASGRITITVDEPVVNGLIELIDENGKTISSAKANGLIFFIDKGALTGGNYIVRISEAGKETIIKKIIFQ